MKSLIVLGAADGSMSMYRTARELGYHTIAVDMRADAPGVRLADEHLQISTRDSTQILAALAGRDDVAGVLAPATDVALPTQKRLADLLGLPCGLSDRAIRASVDKRFFRTLCDELAMPSYSWAEGDDPGELFRLARDFLFPIVVKPADAQSGRGVTRCSDPSIAHFAIQEAFRHSPGGQVLIEEEVPGLHCGCECIVDDGRVAFVALTERLLTDPPLAITTGHMLPAQLPAGVHERVVSIVDALCESLGYERGPLNIDLVIDPAGVPYLIEMGARTGGDPLGDLVRSCHGVDPILASIKVALGESIRLEPREPAPVMVQLLNADRPGELIGITGLSEARAIPEVQEVVLLADPGDWVRPGANLASKLGYALLASAAPAALPRAADLVRRTVRFEIDEPVQESA
jgi:biotin carboxylase